MQSAIKIETVSKRYQIGKRLNGNLNFQEQIKDLLLGPFQRLGRAIKGEHLTRTEEFWALRDVSFEVKPGEIVGIIGRNGAGKSTLLKILSRITEPTMGQITITGRVASLLEVGTGFHPELTGRENVYLNGSILGMKKSEIKAKFDEIVAFSGIEQFIDTPVKRYSSGMYVRLAFSVAAHLEPEILIVDEVLAVGDAEFQQKCLGKMQDASGIGRTVLFVSHNMGAIQNLCSRGILLKHGKMIDDGPSTSVVRNYLSKLSTEQKDAFSLSNPDRRNTGIFRLTEGYLTDNQGQLTENIMAGESIAFNFNYESEKDLENLIVTLSLYNESGVPITSIHTGLKDFSISSTGRRGIITCSIPKNPLAMGGYRVSIAVDSYGKTLDLIPGALSFTVMGSVFFGTSKVPQRRYCTIYMDHAWSLERQK